MGNDTTDATANTDSTASTVPTEASTDTDPRFADFALAPTVAQAITDLGYETPSPIQAQTIPLLLEGRDVIGLAQTGTGKTAAFSLPLLTHIAHRSRPEHPLALILAPTRELAIQVAEALTSYAAHLEDFSVLPIYGGQSYTPQIAGLKRGAHVVVGTPGRVIDHMKRGTLDLSEIEHLVLDEADEMLKMGFQEDIEEIFAKANPDRQVALFSATMPASIHRITGQYLNDPAEVRIKTTTTTSANIRQRYLTVMHSHKLDALTRILEVEEYDGIIMFVRTKQETEELADKLRARGFTAAAINGDIPQAVRERTVENLRSGTIDILVATDVAARGLDVERIELVVNFDIPNDTESYVHRIGRTGRAGRTGEAILFVTPRENRLLKAIEKATRQKVEPLVMPTVDELTNTRTQKFKDRITEALSSQDLNELRPVIDEYVNAHDVPAADIAAALATLVLDGESLKADPLPEPQTRSSRNERERTAEGMTTYRVAVGRMDNVSPGAIVGAIANEGGISSKQIGQISIRSNHSLVDLPEDLDPSVLDRLEKTKVGGRFIDIRKDTGRPGRPFKKRSNDKGAGEGRNFGGRGPKKDRKDHRKGGSDYGRKKYSR